MDCPDVLDRLVALEDGELGPSEDLLVRRHLASCEACGRTAARLTSAVPLPTLRVPPSYAARLADMTGASIAAAASPLSSAPRSMRTFHVSTPVALGYALALALAVAWGTANWRERASLEAQLAAAPSPAAAAPEIPAEDYRPASWTPGTTSDSSRPSAENPATP